MSGVSPREIAEKLLRAAETSAMSVSWDPVNGWRFEFGDVFAGVPMADDDAPRQPLKVVAPPAQEHNWRYWPEEKLVPCGTPTAFKRHKARKEEPCGPCQKAIRDYDRERKRKWYAEQKQAKRRHGLRVVS